MTLESAEVAAEILDAVDSQWVTCDYDSANWSLPGLTRQSILSKESCEEDGLPGQARQ